MYKVADMTEDYAMEVNTWKYATPYEMYSFDGDDEDFEQILSGYYFAVLKNNELIGFLSLGPAAQKRCDENENIFEDEEYTDIAFGLRPDLTGRGYGREFVEACIAGAKEFFPDDGIRICVMNDNERALKLYFNMGFKDIYKNKDFMIMILEG